MHIGVIFHNYVFCCSLIGHIVNHFYATNFESGCVVIKHVRY